MTTTTIDRDMLTRSARCLVICLAAGALSAGEASGAEWRQFRGPGTAGVSPEADTPVEWSAEENIVWKTALPGAGTSSPIVVDGRVYLTSYTGFNVPGRGGGVMSHLKRHLLCVDRKTGKLLWAKELKTRLPEQRRIRDDHGYASSTPVSDGESVFVFAGKSGVFAFDLEGKPLWQADVGHGMHGWGSAASPIVYKDLVIVNASVESQSLVALNKKTGEQVWKVGGIKEAWNTPLLVPLGGGKHELAVSIPRKVIGLDPDTGRELWTCDTDITWYMVPSMVAEDGIIYCVGGKNGKCGSMAIRAGGRGDVTDTHRLWWSEQRSNVNSPIYHDGLLYFAHEQQAIVYCLDAKTGELKYEHRLGPRAGQVYPSPVLAGGKLYYTTRRGGIFVLAAGPEFRQLARNRLDDSTINSTPTVSGDNLLIRTNTHLYCIGD